jgi:hypothetical protein
MIISEFIKIIICLKLSPETTKKRGIIRKAKRVGRKMKKMAKNCSWCNNPLGEKFWFRNIDVNGKVKKSVQKFYSPKCEFEFAYEVTLGINGYIF